MVGDECPRGLVKSKLAPQMMIRLVKRDLKINAGEKHVLDALGPSAYQAFQVVDRRATGQ